MWWAAGLNVPEGSFPFCLLGPSWPTVPGTRRVLQGELNIWHSRAAEEVRSGVGILGLRFGSRTFPPGWFFSGPSFLTKWG